MPSGATFATLVTARCATATVPGAIGYDEITLSMLDSITRVKAGDLSEIEEMLMGQAKACQAIFLALAYRTAKGIDNKPGAAGPDTSTAPVITPAELLGLALQAQRQSVGAIKALRNPARFAHAE